MSPVPFVLTPPSRLDWGALPSWASSLIKCSVNESPDFILDLSPIDFCFPLGVATLAAGVDFLREKGLSLRRVEKPKSEDPHRYLQRMQVFSCLGVDEDLKFDSHAPDLRFLELRRLRTADDCSDAANELSALLAHHLGLDERQESALNITLAELAENAIHHSHSPTGALVCSQYYPRMKLLHAAIVDLGVGIAHNLNDNPDAVARIQQVGGPLTAALELGVTSRPSRNAGSGLFFAAELARRNGGALRIHSHWDSIQSTDSTSETISNGRWPGTALEIRLYCDKFLNMKVLFDKYRPEDAEDPEPWPF